MMLTGEDGGDMAAANNVENYKLPLSMENEHNVVLVLLGVLDEKA